MGHPALKELIRYIDDELTPSARTRIDLHVCDCVACQAELRRLSATGAEIDAIHQLTAKQNFEPLSEQRAALQARLQTITGNQATATPPIFTWMRTLAYAAALLLLAGTGWVIASKRGKTHDQTVALPNPTYTPGAVRQVSLGQICAASDEEVVREVPAAIEQTVFREYGLGRARPGDYEVDHLITPGLGGSDDVANLWPQPHSSHWNSFVKDQLEDHLHHMVCRGQLPLSAAQHEIASNWIAAYKKYFHTQEPLRASSAARPLQRLALLR